MKQVGEKLDPLCEPRSGAREVCVRVNREYRRTWNKRKATRGFYRSSEAITTRRYYKYVRPCIDHVLPHHPARVSTRLAERVVTTGGCDHLGDPVPAAENGVGPLEKYDAPRFGGSNGFPHSSDPSAAISDEPRSLVGLDPIEAVRALLGPANQD